MVTVTATLQVTGCQEYLIPLPEAGANSSFAEGVLWLKSCVTR